MRALLIAAGLAVASCGTSWAQTAADGSVRGYVKDAQGGVLPGASVTMTGPATARLLSATSDAEGLYRVLNVPPGLYELTVELAGFSRFVRQGIVMRAGQSLTIDAELSLGAMTETVEVTVDPPLIDTTSTVQTVNISGEMQRGVPVSPRRHWADFLGLTPGISGMQVPGRTADTYYLRGSGFDAHVMQVDGADMSSSQQNATSYMHFSNEAIADVQVKTGAVDASSPLGIGAIINVVTKSGTNDLSGAAGFVWQPLEWNGTNLPGGTSAALDQFIPEVALGGPILRNRLWYFGTYRYERIESGISRAPDQIAILRALVPSFEPYPARITGHQFFLKVTGQIGTRHNLEGSYHRDPQETATGSALEAASYQTINFGGDVNGTARLSSVWSPSLTTRLSVSHNNKALQIQVGPDNTSQIVHHSMIVSGGRASGTGRIAILDNTNNGWSFDQPYYKTTVSGDLDYYRSGWLGSHEFRTGFYWQLNHQETAQRFANGGFSRQENILRDPANPGAGLIPFWREVYDVASVTTADADHRDLAFYVQDVWRPTPRLTVNAGVRVDFVKRQDNIFDETTQDSAEIGPRVGATYVLSEGQKDVVRASWVRAHDVLSGNRASVGSVAAGKRDLYDLDLDGVFETSFVTPASTVRVNNRTLDMDRGQPYINEAVVGYKRQLPARTAVDVSFVHREYRHRTALLETNAIYDGNVFVGYRDEAFNDMFLLTANTWNWHVYNALEFQATQQTRRVQLIGSYTRSWRHLAGDWQPRDPASFIQPDAFPNNKGIGDVRESSGNSLSGSSQTSNNSWQDHIVRLGGVVRFPWEVVFALNYSFQSAAYAGPVLTRLPAPDPQFGPPTVRLSNGRVVTNPLSTVLRFAQPTRGDKQPQLDDVHLWNMRLGRDFTFGVQKIELAMDVFNITNAGSDQQFRNGANQLYSGNYGLGDLRQFPRSARLWVRFSF